MTNRYVPFVTGLVAVALAGVLFFTWFGILASVVGGLLLWYAVVCFKTAWFATDLEIEELTTDRPMSKETEGRLKSWH